MPPNPGEGRNAAAEYCRLLHERHGPIVPDTALYLDFEGNGSGQEYVLSLFWKGARQRPRLHLIRPASGRWLAGANVHRAFRRLGCYDLGVHAVVVFSASEDGTGPDGSPDERRRLLDLMDGDPFGDGVQWVNLWAPMRRSRRMRELIRRRRFSKPEGHRLPDNSLENLENAFGIERPARLASLGRRYKDAREGRIQPLTLAQRVATRTASDAEIRTLREYCRWDVESLYRIVRRCDEIC